MKAAYPGRLWTGLEGARLYVVPARPCNDNRGASNAGGNAFLRLVGKVAFSWKIRRAFLLGIAKGSVVEKK